MYYKWKTKPGEFKIVQEKSGRRQAMFEDEGLGSYATAQQALDDLARGHSFWPSCGDPSNLGLSDDLSDWVLIRR